MRSWPLVRAAAWAVFAGLALAPRAWADFADGQNASIVLGKTNFTTTGFGISQSTMEFVMGLTFDGSGNLWVADSGNSRVLKFTPPFARGMNASLVIGQPDFVSQNSTAGQSTFNSPDSVAFDAAGNLWVGEHDAARVLMFQPPFTNGMNASLVIGQSNFTSTIAATTQNGLSRVARGSGILFDSSGNLWVADSLDSRVLRYSPPFTTGMNANLVIGPSDFVSISSGCAANTFNAGPGGLAFDAAGNLWVADFGRILKFAPPFSTGMSASSVLGSGFTSCTIVGPLPPTQDNIGQASSLLFDPLGNLWAADGNINGNRVLRYSPPLSGAVNASLVLGQAVFTTTQAATTQKGMDAPTGLAFASGSLWVAEIGNDRVTRFDNVPSSATAVAALTPTTSTVQLSWTATDNPFGASFSGSYAVQYSSDPAAVFSTTAAQISVSTANVPPLAAQSYLVGGLLANTTYFFRVWSANIGLNYSPISAGASVATLAQAPAANPPALLGVFLTSATAQWAALAAAPSSATAEGYRVEASSTNFGAGTVYSSATLAVAQSTLTVSGLSQNTTYYFRVASLNWASAPNYTTLGSTVTLAAPPSALAVGAVSSTSVSLSWSADGNPVWTPYEVSISTDNFLTSISTPVAFASNLTAAATTLSLAAGTTYYFRVRAQNAASVKTALSATASTVTLPGLLTSISTSAPSTTAVSWSWTNTAGPAVQSYSVYTASNAVLLGTTGATTFARTGLSTNTAYGVRIGAVDATGPGPLSAPVTAYTLAAPPTVSTFTAVYLSSLTLSWSVNGNPGGTLYEVHRSTDNIAFVLLSTQTAATLSDTQIGNATFYYKVRARNGDGLATAFDVTLSTFLAGQTPAAPSGLTAANPAGGLVTLAWTPSAGPDVLQYDVYWDAGTGAVDYNVTYTTVAASETSVTLGPLPAATYYFALRAKNTIFLEEKNVNVRASVTLPVSAPFTNWTQAQIHTPRAGRKVWGNRVTVLASVIRGSPALAQASFQYRSAASTTAPWTPIPAVAANNPRVGPLFLIHWDMTALAPGDYELRSVASNAAGQADPAAPTRLLTVNSVDPDVEELLLGGSLQHREKVENATANTIVLGSLTGDRYHQVVLPSGALGAGPATVLKILNPPASVPAVPPEFSAVGVFYDITLENGQTALSAAAWLTAFYRDDNGDGIVDGTPARADRLKFMAYNPASGKWTAENPTTLDFSGKTAAAPTGHFSLFGLFAPSAVDLDRVRVYPNPFVPNDGADDNGKPFSSSDPFSGVIFDNITQAARIQVFTVSGQLVWETTVSNTSGKIQWDGRNSNGRAVASGGYIAVIGDTATGRKAVRKIAIIR